jgi:hypothetical protein
MHLKLFKSLWEVVEFTGSPLRIRMNEHVEAYIATVAEAGYAGIESPLPIPEQEDLFNRLLEKYHLEYIAQVLTEEPHASSFEAQVRDTARFNPLFIVSQSAKDWMPYEDQKQYFEQAVAVERELGIAVAHETHRGRALNVPWNAARLLDEVPGLKLNADFSHWCCVCESLLQDQTETVAKACSHSIHIHGRIGHAEGPQVADPRAPEYAHEFEIHMGWWEKICKARMQSGAEWMTFTPEFGPPGYMPTLPFTKQPVTDVWEVNLWMAEQFRIRFERLLAAKSSS